MRKMNNKLSNNIAFFDYTITSIEFNQDLTIYINHEFKTKKIIVSFKDCSINTDIKNKSIFTKLIGEELVNLIDNLRQYNYLNKIAIKTKSNDININIDYKFLEIFMHKSPNWITMGKAFSLVYNFKENKYLYNIDSIGLETSIKNQEKLLFSKLSFAKNLLPVELQDKMIEYSTKIEKPVKTNALLRLIDNIRKLFKK